MSLQGWLIFSALLFSLGLYGVLTRKNAVLVLASVELMLAEQGITRDNIDEAELNNSQSAERIADVLWLEME